jgi:hypothetical protein
MKFSFRRRRHKPGKILSLKAKTTIEYLDSGVRKVIYTLPPPGRGESVLAFSLPRGGSVLLEKVMRDLSRICGIVYVSITTHFFKLGLIDEWPASTANIFKQNGYCYGGFRGVPSSFNIPILGTSKTILLIRDPRDMLVSNYFSTRDSHPDPGAKLKRVKLPHRELARRLSIDEYVLALAPSYKDILLSYIEMLVQHPNCISVFRYEDVIFTKRQWVSELCNALGWSVTVAEVTAIADKYDERPTSENPTKHLRQLVPEDFRRKLRNETIERLGQFFEKELSFFGYR